jgi:predicted peptidase
MTGCKLALSLIALASLASFSARAASPVAHGFVDRVFRDGSEESKYVVFVPHDYRGDKAFPAIAFLHGSGETGTDGHKQTQVGLGPAIRKQEKTFPFIAVFPQSKKRNWKASSVDGIRALKILDEVEKEYRIDPDRVYLTGISMGGFGTWSIAMEHPERWAAIVPVCGGGDPKQVDRIKGIPCWCFHGGADGIVPVGFSRRMRDALEKAGSQPRYTEYPKVGHNSWDRAYGTAELYTWLLSHHLHK